MTHMQVTGGVRKHWKNIKFISSRLVKRSLADSFSPFAFNIFLGEQIKLTDLGNKLKSQLEYNHWSIPVITLENYLHCKIYGWI